MNSWLARMGRPYFERQAVFYLIALVAAEILGARVRPWAGMALDGFILVLLILHASLGEHGLRQRFLLALALAPLIRVISLALILQNFPPILWYSAVGVPLFLAAFLTARQSRLKKDMLGLTLHGWPVQLLVGLAGLGLGFLEYLILRPQPLVSDFRWQPIALTALALLVFTGLLEELIFRGLIQYTALACLGRFSLLYVSALYAVLYMSLRPGPDLLFVFATALLFGKVVQRTGSILGASLSHGLMNIGLFLVFPLLLARPGATPVTGSTQVPAPAKATVTAAAKADAALTTPAADAKTVSPIPASPVIQVTFATPIGKSVTSSQVFVPSLVSMDGSPLRPDAYDCNRRGDPPVARRDL